MPRLGPRFFSAPRPPTLLAPLAHCFKQENRGRLGNIQGIDLPSHGDADGGRTVPDGTHPRVLSAHDECTGATQIDLGIALTGCWRGDENFYMALT